MNSIFPAIKSLPKRKLGVFLIAIQIALATAILSHLSYLSHEFGRKYALSPTIPDDLLFTILVRRLDDKVNYEYAMRDIESLKKIDQVISASVFRWAPYAGNANIGAIRSQQDVNSPTQAAAIIPVSPQALKTLQLDIIAGRNFKKSDMIAEKVTANDRIPKIVITHTLAIKLFGDETSAIGKMAFDGDTTFEIIGVTRDWPGTGVHPSDFSENTLFVPHYWEGDPEQRYMLRVSNSDYRENAIAESVKKIKSNYKNNVFVYAEKIDELRKNSSLPGHTFANLLMIINIVLGITLVFAMSGQTIFSVIHRTRQLGLYRALGANQRDIVILLLAENLITCLIGLTAGTLFALYLNGVITKLGYAPLPIPYLIITCLSLLILSIAGTIIPATYARKIPPSLATRTL